MALSPEMKQTRGLIYLYFKVRACQGQRGIMVKHRVQETMKPGMTEYIDLAVDVGKIINKMLKGKFAGQSLTSGQWHALKCRHGVRYGGAMPRAMHMQVSRACERLCIAFEHAELLNDNVLAMGRTFHGWRFMRIDGIARYVEEPVAQFLEDES